MSEKEGHKLETNTDNSDGINLLFSMQELKRAVRQEHNTTPGRDGLGSHSGWVEACSDRFFKPILKPGKEADSPGSYRPIALTEVICKIMERMVTDWLVYRLEQRGYFSPFQSGFRLGRATMDAILMLHRDIKALFRPGIKMRPGESDRKWPALTRLFTTLVNKEVVIGVLR